MSAYHWLEMVLVAAVVILSSAYVLWRFVPALQRRSGAKAEGCGGGCERCGGCSNGGGERSGPTETSGD